MRPNYQSFLLFTMGGFYNAIITCVCVCLCLQGKEWGANIISSKPQNDKVYYSSHCCLRTLLIFCTCECVKNCVNKSAVGLFWSLSLSRSNKLLLYIWCFVVTRLVVVCGCVICNNANRLSQPKQTIQSMDQIRKKVYKTILNNWP